MKYLAAALTAVLMAGCASQVAQNDLDAIRAMAEQAQSAADRAQQSADAAAAKADAADRKAEQAMNAAEDAKACCNANSEKIDRMFRKAMTK